MNYTWTPIRFLLALMIVIPEFAFCQQPARWEGTLDSFFKAHAVNGDFSGSVLVSQKGSPLFQRSYGFASATFGVKNASSTKFAIASVTKTFTAAAIVLLQQDGKLNIDDSLARFLPTFPHANEIKIRHLLLHQSGLQNPDYAAIAAQSVSPEELLQMMGAKPLLFEPGKASRYSNAGYVVLANVVEKASGSNFCAYLSRRIFVPLGMNDSGCMDSRSIISQFAEGYMPGLGTELQRTPLQDPSSFFGSGNVYSTTQDLNLWLQAIDNKRLFDITKLLYPFGWGRRKWSNRELIVQSGIISGYSSIILTVPAEQLHLVVLMNTQSGVTADEGKSLISTVFGEPPALPEKRSHHPVAGEKLAIYAGDYTFPQGSVPMHIRVTNGALGLRWDRSNQEFVLTPLADDEFLDRSSFGRIVFAPDRLFWISNGEKLECLKQAKSAP
jgi:CubicO group peptidase (beta-lactamase class C family)